MCCTYELNVGIKTRENKPYLHTIVNEKSAQFVTQLRNTGTKVSFMIVDKASVYRVCDWLRKLDLNQRPSGYELVYCKSYNLANCNTKTPYLRALLHTKKTIQVKNTYTHLLIFCRGIIKTDKKNCTKTAQKFFTTFNGAILSIGNIANIIKYLIFYLSFVSIHKMR